MPTSTGGTTNISRPLIGNVPYGQVIDSCVTPGNIAITFDDGPYIYTSDLLDLLDRYGAKVTFFLIGDQIPGYSSVVSRMYSSGHQVASHTYTHPDLTTLSSGQRKDEMYQTETEFSNLLGVFPTYMRPPYLSTDEDTLSDLKDLGYHVVSTNLDTKDYANDSPELIINAERTFNSTLDNNPASSND